MSRIGAILVKLVLFAMLLGSGCRGSASSGGDPDSGSDTDDIGSSSGDTASDGTDGQAPAIYPRPCADLYDEASLPKFELEMSDDEWRAMESDCRQGTQRYRPVVFKYGGESVDAMIRLKGNWSWSCEKMQFVISFNEADKDGRFHGLRKIVLDAPWYDPTLLHERLAFFFLKQYGVEHSCVNNARLVVNGVYYGVFANVERLDREYLERHYDQPDGNLYKEGRELKTNEETADTSRNDAFWRAQDVDTLNGLVDLAQAVAIWAGLAMAPDPDSYWAGVEINFYLYDHPTRGFLFLPYDMDIAFAENLWSELASADPITYEHEEWRREAQYAAVLSDTEWCNAFVEALVRANEAYEPMLLTAKLDEWSRQISTAVEADPNRPYSMEEHREALAALRTFFSRRKTFVTEWLDAGDQCPVTWPSTTRFFSSSYL